VETLELLKTLTEAAGPSGFEGNVAAIIRELWMPYVDEIRTDALGNLIAVQHGNGPEPRPALMAAAHSDEIALIVKGSEDGFLQIGSLGGMDRRVLLGLAVTVHAEEPLLGVIGSRPPHVLTPAEREETLPWHKVFVDVGLPAEEVARRVRVGDTITFDRPLIELQNGCVAGKACDNRASVAALTLALAALRQREHSWDFYAVATVQEEVGCKGAVTSAYGIAPQIAIALDVTFAKQHDDSDPGAFDLNKGPTVGIGPNFHPQVVEKLKAAGDAGEIPYQIEPLPGSSGTDAWAIQVAREGIPCGLISIPARYMHQPVELLSLRDVERAGRLLCEYVAALQPTDLPRWEDEA